jgi:hypothetical protein
MKNTIMTLATLLSLSAFAEKPVKTPELLLTLKAKGTLYEMNSNKSKKLFIATKASEKKGDTLKTTMTFSDMDNKVAAVQEQWYKDGVVTKHVLTLNQTGETGTVEFNGDQVTFKFGKPGDEKTGKEKLEENTLINDQIVPFIHTHWDELMKGDTIKFRLIVPQRTETVGFKFFKDSEGMDAAHGKEVVKIIMKPSSFVIAALVDPLTFIFEKGGQHMFLENIGRTTPMKKVGDKWKDLDTEITWEIN